MPPHHPRPPWLVATALLALLAVGFGALGEADHRATLVFTGDVGLAWHKKKSNERNNAWQRTRLSGIAPLLEGADLALANMEGVMSRQRPKSADRLTDMWVDPATAPVFANAGVDLVSLANNHAFDAGNVGVMETIAALDATGVTVIGAGEDVRSARAAHVTELRGRCIAFVPATLSSNEAVTGPGPGFIAAYPLRSAPNYLALLDLIEATASECEFVVVYLHWARSNTRHPTPFARKLARMMAASGADLIVGHHPHMLQGVEYVGAVPVAYSLGNTVFANPSKRTRRTGLLRVTLKTAPVIEVERVELAPVVIRGSDFTPHPATERQARKIYNVMKRISAPFATRVELRGGLLSFAPPD